MYTGKYNYLTEHEMFRHTNIWKNITWMISGLVKQIF